MESRGSIDGSFDRFSYIGVYLNQRSEHTLLGMDNNGFNIKSLYTFSDSVFHGVDYLRNINPVRKKNTIRVK